MSSIFKNVVYNKEVAGQYIKKIIEKSRGKTVSSRKLITTLRATRLVINSNAFQVTGN